MTNTQNTQNTQNTNNATEINPFEIKKEEEVKKEQAEQKQKENEQKEQAEQKDIEEQIKFIPDYLDSLNQETDSEEIEQKLEYLKKLLTAKKLQNFNAKIFKFLSDFNSKPSKMFFSLISSPNYSYDIIRKKNNQYELIKKESPVLFYDIEKSIKAKYGIRLATGSIKPDTTKTTAQKLVYEHYTSRFLNNLARSFISDLNKSDKKDGNENKERKLTEVLTLNSKFSDIDSKVDFNSCTNNAMLAQLNAIVSTILPEDLTVKMIRSDLRAISSAFKKYSVSENSFTIRREEELINIIFNAIRTRYQNLSYSVESKAKAHKAEKAKKSK